MAELPYRPQFWSGKTALVTGATGFLGGWLVRRLLDHGAAVVALVRGPSPRSQFEIAGLDKRSTVVRGNVSDPGVIAAAFAARPIDAVFHLAANVDVERALREPQATIAEATEATLAIVEEVRRRRPQCAVVVASSDKAYGPQPVPYREDANLAPRHPYEVAKACQDLIAQSYGKVYGLPVTVTRCGNYFGGFDFKWQRIIPGTIRALLAGEPVVLRSDGKFTRDFLYVEDAVDVHLALAERSIADPTLRGEAFNFSHEVDIEVIDIVRRLIALVGAKIEPQIQNTAQQEIRFIRVSSDKARERLGWRPRHDFDAALAETVGWYRDYLSDPARARAASS